MAEFPALPFYTDAYLADTRHLTSEEHGVYLLLLMCAWRTRGCALRDDDRMLARIAGVSASKWRKVRPLMLEFFTVADGYWRQKKLTQVYSAVAQRVERNRINGAKGGRAKSAKGKGGSEPGNCLKTNDTAKANGSFSVGWSHVVGDAEELATKARTKTKQGSSAESMLDEKRLKQLGLDIAAIDQIAAAAALETTKIDLDAAAHWLSSDACLGLDIVPTIKRVRARELGRSGQAPFHLAYYTAAIFDARDKRVSTGRKDADCSARRAKRQQNLIKFNTTDCDHWRRFLGDQTSRFRGEYLSRHWCIPTDHPFFEAYDLGPDPCHRPNGRIPKEIYQEYGPLWNWRREMEPR